MMELRRKEQNATRKNIIKYTVGEKFLIRNRQQPSSSEDNQNNTYVVTDPFNNKVRGTYNLSLIHI